MPNFSPGIFYLGYADSASVWVGVGYHTRSWGDGCTGAGVCTHIHHSAGRKVWSEDHHACRELLKLIRHWTKELANMLPFIISHCLISHYIYQLYSAKWKSKCFSYSFTAFLVFPLSLVCMRAPFPESVEQESVYWPAFCHTLWSSTIFGFLQLPTGSSPWGDSHSKIYLSHNYHLVTICHLWGAWLSSYFMAGCYK